MSTSHTGSPSLRSPDTPSERKLPISGPNPLTIVTPDSSAVVDTRGLSSVSLAHSPARWKSSKRRSQCRSHSLSDLPLRFAGWARLTFVLVIFSLALWYHHTSQKKSAVEVNTIVARHPLADHVLIPVNKQPLNRKITTPEKWLRTHSSLGSCENEKPPRSSKRPRAAIISLVRNEELEGILQSMRQLEYRWNGRFQYPWMFFSEKPFNDDFKRATSNATTAKTSYHLIPKPHWSIPAWIDMDRYMDSLEYLSMISVGKGYMPSYRNMCRWNSGFFYKHPALQAFDYYWRVEPDVHFFCDIPYDPFAFMADNKLIYGFNMNILDDARSFASLWKKTQAFVREFPHLVHKDADMTWLIDQKEGGEYNNCQFFSNFEIGDLNFFRGEGNEAYFKYIDETGGFYYERFGDAPVHTLSVALFAPKDKVWFFRDIGYQHDIARHCPLEGVKSGRCDCEATGLDENFFKLVPMESPQRKPSDTCIRQWLGGKWLDTKRGWSQEAERTLGGNGYGGYVHSEPEGDD